MNYIFRQLFFKLLMNVELFMSHGPSRSEKRACF